MIYGSLLLRAEDLKKQNDQFCSYESSMFLLIRQYYNIGLAWSNSALE